MLRSVPRSVPPHRLHALGAMALAFAGFVLALPPSTSFAHDEAIDAASLNKLTTLSNELIAAVGAYHRATGAKRNAVAAKLKTVARERRNLMLKNIERQPGLTLRQSLPAGLTVGLPADVRDLVEQDVELTGRIVGLHGDDMVKQVSSRKYFLELAGEPRPERLRLHAADLPDHLDHLHPVVAFMGQEVTIKGMRLDGHLLISGPEAIAGASLDGSGGSSTTTTAAAAVSGNQNTLVLMANFQDKALSCSTTEVNDVMFGPSNSVAGLYSETSYNQVTFSGATYGPWQIPYNSTDACAYSTWSAAMDNIATAQGINLANYPRRVYVFPGSTCGAGYGSLGGSVTRSWIFHCGLRDVYAHELGHNLGLHHAWTPGSEYGDTSSIMGRGGYALRHFNSVNKVATGWVPASRAQDVSAAGTFTLEPLAAANPVGVQTLKLVKPDTKDFYFISLRQPIGYDSGLASGYQNRISIHRGTTTLSAYTYLLGTLGVGQSYTDTVNGYTFTATSIGTGTATVNVGMTLPDCVRAAPTVSISPITQSAAAGKTLNYQINVTNNNNIGCGASTFSFTPQVPSGWSAAYAPTTVSLATGVSTSAVWSVTSPTTGVLEQSYPVYTTVYDTAAATSSATVQGNTIVTMPDATPPTVAISAPTNGATVSGRVSVTASASDNIGVARVEFRVNGSLKATDTAAPYSFSLSTRKLKGLLTIEARAFDAAGNAATTSVQVTAQ